MDVIEFVEKFKERHRQELEEVFTCGYCYWFAFILCERFNGTIVYNPIDCHFAMKLDESIYDITGEIESKGFVDWKEYQSEEIADSLRAIKNMILKEN